MRKFKFIIRGLAFYKIKHLAVLLATILSTAILTGALVVGDSVKYSLQQMVSQRLGSVGYALRSGDHMVSQQLLKSLANELNTKVAGVIETHGVAINSEKDLRINQTKIYGVDSSFWNLSNQEIGNLAGNEVYISQNLAERISIDSGDFLLARVHVPQSIAINTPFSQDENITTAIRLKVKGILSDDSFGRFSLKSDQKSPFNIFVSYEYLSINMDMTDKVNQILIEDKNGLSVEQLNNAVSKLWQLTDMGFKILQLNDKKFRLSSDQIFINEALAYVVRNSKQNVNPVFTYLINELSAKNNSTPYSFVAGLNIADVHKMRENDIIINQWLADDLQLKIGDSISIKYFAFGSFRNIEEQQANFIVSRIEPNEGEWFNKALMPDFPGLANAGSCSEWEAGINIDLDKIRTKDEDYWDDFKGTPKAIISYKKAQQLWENNYGSHTGFFIKGNEKQRVEFENYLKQNITPEFLGLNFIAVKQLGNKAATSGVDFGELFLSLSFFIIVAAILLLMLIYALNLSSRKAEIATLNAIGFKPKLIVRLILAESFITVVIGSVLGGFLGIVYNKILINALNSIWYDAVYTNALTVHITTKSIIIGICVGLVISFLTLLRVVKKQNKLAVVSVFSESDTDKKYMKLKVKTLAFALSILVLIAFFYGILSSGFNPTFALLLGGLFLVNAILWFNVFLKQILERTYSNLSTTVLALKSMASAKIKSVVVITMLALGIFSVLITGANRKTFSGSDSNNSSGIGGFTYWAETTLPVLYNLNTRLGKEKLGIDDESIFDTALFLPMHKLQGDDASCLNLNQVQQPSILGLDANVLNQQRAFSFAKLLPEVSPDNPWLFLTQPLNKNVYPVYLDQTVIQWGLMKKVGDTLQILSEKGDSISLVIAGGLNASVFQGHMLMDQSVFKYLFPENGGANVFLINSHTKQNVNFEELMNYYLSDFGISLQKTNSRLAQFNSVTNTYLNVFMLLGSLAMIIGTFGLGLVIIRSLMDRKKEFAVLQAIGWKRKMITSLVLKEYIIVLFTGLVFGCMSALIGMIPSFLSEAFDVPWIFIVLTLLAITINGLVWIVLPTIWSFRRSILDALKSE